jgi:uncharacterized damage-inducible protein DinB
VTDRFPRPDPAEYGAWYRSYVELVPDGDILERLERQMTTTRALLAAVPREREDARYAPGKWSVREVVGHLADTEWVFLYRALTMARGDAGPLPGMDHELWGRTSNAHERPLSELAEDWAAVRAAGLRLFRSLDGEAARRSGVASEKPFTVRSFPWILAGHELHHVERLQDDYGLAAAP